MKNLWAPWRITYLKEKDRDRGCVFCRKVRRNLDQKEHVIHRGRKNYVVLNKYPYNNGHLMIVPYRHTAQLESLSEAEIAEMMLFLKKGIRILKKTYRPQGFNWGMNLGKSAGAGIAGHLHLHLIPRWEADTNFLPAIAEVRCLPQHLEATWKELKKNWRKSS